MGGPTTDSFLSLKGRCPLQMDRLAHHEGGVEVIVYTNPRLSRRLRFDRPSTLVGTLCGPNPIFVRRVRDGISGPIEGVFFSPTGAHSSATVERLSSGV